MNVNMYMWIWKEYVNVNMNMHNANKAATTINQVWEFRDWSVIMKFLKIFKFTLNPYIGAWHIFDRSKLEIILLKCFKKSALVAWPRNVEPQNLVLILSSWSKKCTIKSISHNWVTLFKLSSKQITKQFAADTLLLSVFVEIWS